MWGQRIRGPGPGPLYIRAQGLNRGELLPRTHNENPKKTQEYGRGRPYAEHLTKHLKKKTNSVQEQDKGERYQHRSTESCI